MSSKARRALTSVAAETGSAVINRSRLPSRPALLSARREWPRQRSDLVHNRVSTRSFFSWTSPSPPPTSPSPPMNSSCSTTTTASPVTGSIDNVAEAGLASSTGTTTMAAGSSSSGGSGSAGIDHASAVTDVLTDATTVDSVSAAAISAVDTVTTVAASLPEPWFFTRLAMQTVEYAHVTGDLSYCMAIIATTMVMRAVLLYPAVVTSRSAARMAVLRPAMQRLQATFTKDPNFEDLRVKMKYQTEMKALFVKYKVNPFHAMLMPLAQLPIFMSFFFGLQSMHQYYPALHTGGYFWFVDLGAPDPYYIFPILNAAGFMLMIEMGADGIQTPQQGTFKMGMRGLAVAMVPLTMHIPQAVFMYWTTNNVFSIIQTLILKTEWVRVRLDIPKPPPIEDTPPLKMKNPFVVMAEAIRKEFDSGSDKVELIDGKSTPSTSTSTSTSNRTRDSGAARPSATSSSSTARDGTPPKPPPETFAAPIRKKSASAGGGRKK